ncbi:MAG: anaerobic sulfatase maturase, partial [Spirochaetota bacterium]
QCQQPFNIIIKPTGSACNLHCDYCYYLDTYTHVMGEGEQTQIMDDQMLEHLTQSYISSQPEGTKEVVFSWQGGEPTLLGVQFFEKALKLQQKYQRPGLKISNALQTNGTLITDDMAKFFHDNTFLIGISIDGTQALHDRYRRDPNGAGSFTATMQGLEKLQQHQVAYNTLTVVQHENANYPEEVYSFLTGAGVRHIQFIPIVEAKAGKVSRRSVSPLQWGAFLQRVFDAWLSKDIGSVYVQHFDLLLGRYLGYPSSLCVHAQSCGEALALEHNGQLYSCDHFVDPEHLLGNIAQTPLAELVDSDEQKRFGTAKHQGLPKSCLQCDFLQLCFGGCLRNRLPDKDTGSDLNYLCEGYKHFYAHTKPYFAAMAKAIKHKHYAKDYTPFLNPEVFKHAERNAPCPCGSGKKFKHCHGRI